MKSSEKPYKSKRRKNIPTVCWNVEYTESSFFLFVFNSSYLFIYYTKKKKKFQFFKSNVFSSISSLFDFSCDILPFPFPSRLLKHIIELLFKVKEAFGYTHTIYHGWLFKLYVRVFIRVKTSPQTFPLLKLRVYFIRKGR